MNSKSELIKQNNLAFDFIEKLYLESSYLVKEIEGILIEEEEKFIIGRPSGYAVSALSSRGLETNLIKSWWLVKKFSVFFIPEDKTSVKGGVTVTKIDKDLKILYLRIVFYDKNIHEPAIYFGVLYNFEKKSKNEYPSKFEQLMAHFENNESKVFKDSKTIDYESAYVKMQGRLIKNNLFDINNSDTIVRKIVKPSLELYRKH